MGIDAREVGGIEDPNVANGDEVILLPGTTNGVYENQADTINISDAITIRSRESDPRPVIPLSSSFGFFVTNSGAVLRRLQLNADAAAGSALFMNSGGTADRLYVSTVGLNVSPCVLGLGSPLMRDSVCLATNGGDALTYSVGGAVTLTATLRNVTAVATGAGARAINVDAGEAGPGGGGANMTLNAANVIASGGTTDVRANTDNSTGVAATINLSSSNYDTRSATGNNASVTDPATSANQMAVPLFEDVPNGDFDQAAGSPTIDAGDPAASMLGTFDLDGDMRSLDGNCDGTVTPDIGADEFTVSCQGPPAPPDPGGGGQGDTAAPDTTITAGPKAKTKSKAASFSFASSEPGSTFECKLDDGAFQPCSSPFEAKVKKGKHTFAVRARDAAGNVDPTPATQSWKVKKKRKR